MTFTSVLYRATLSFLSCWATHKSSYNKQSKTRNCHLKVSSTQQCGEYKPCVLNWNQCSQLGILREGQIKLILPDVEGLNSPDLTKNQPSNAHESPNNSQHQLCYSAKMLQFICVLSNTIENLKPFGPFQRQHSSILFSTNAWQTANYCQSPFSPLLSLHVLQELLSCMSCDYSWVVH